MPFLDENVANGIPEKTASKIGGSDVDSGEVLEKGILIPFASDPEASWVYFNCVVSTLLDSGIVVHNRLPQVNNDPDTLGSAALDAKNYDLITNLGVNLECEDQYTDVVQRMGHSRYWFRLWGQALRVGYRVPIPSLKSVGGVAVIPYDKSPQKAFNRIVPMANYSGAILWHAAWSLWYTTAVPLRSQYIPEHDPSAHISGTEEPPLNGFQAPFSPVDDNAVKALNLGTFGQQLPGGP
jgi:hypothetical protein